MKNTDAQETTPRRLRRMLEELATLDTRALLQVKPLFDADPARYAIDYADALRAVVEKANEARRTYYGMVRERASGEEDRAAFDVKIRLASNTICDAIAQWNRILLPECEAARRRKRATYALKYLNIDTYMTEMLQVDRVAHYQNSDNASASETLGWTLFLLSRHMMRVGRMLEGAKLLKEFDTVLRGNLLSAQLKRARTALGKRLDELVSQKSDPLHIMRVEAQTAEKLGDLRAAFDAYERMLRQDPESAPIQASLGWVIERQIRALASTSNAPEDTGDRKLSALFARYLSLSRIAKPSILHSRLLSHATRLASRQPRYVDFVRQWGLEHLREEDFLPEQSRTGATYSSLVERLVLALYRDMRRHANDVVVSVDFMRTALATLYSSDGVGQNAAQGLSEDRGAVADTSDNRHWAADFVGQQIVRYPQRREFRFYYGRMLTFAREYGKAREVLVPMMVTLGDKYWYWTALSAAHADGDPALPFACRCKAALCPPPTDAKYLRSLRLELGAVFEQRGLIPAAIREYQLCLNGGQSRMAQDALSRLTVKAVSASVDNTALYREFAVQTEGFIQLIAPWRDAVLTAKQRDERGVVTGFMIAVPQEEVPVEIMAPTHLAPDLLQAPSGAPVSVRLAQTDGKWVLLAVEGRNGSRWDVYPARTAVLIEANPSKGVSVAEFPGGDCCYIQHSQFPHVVELSAGAVVAVKTRDDRIRKQHIAVAVEAGANEALPAFRRSFAGQLSKVSDRGGIAVDGVWIPRRLLSQVRASEGTPVTGIAINATKGWRAVTLIKQD